MAGKSGAVRAGGAFVELFSDDSKLARGLKAASGKLKSWGKDVSAVGRGIFEAGGVVKAAFTGAAAIFAEVGAELAHMSARTGIGVASLSQLRYAAEQSGVGLEDFETGIKKMQKTLGQASIGSAAAVKALADIGLTAQDLINLSPEEQFERIAAEIAAIPNPAQRAAAAMAIFGKNGTTLLPMLLKGADGIRALKTEADRLGLTMSKEDAESAVELQNAMKSVWATLRGVAVAIGSALAPTMTDLAKRAATLIGNFTNWIKENRGLVVTVSTIATAVVGVGAALLALGTGISFLAPAFAGLGMAVSGFGAAIGLVVSVIGFILSPIGLVVAAVVAMGAYFVSTSDVVSDAFAGLSDVFGEMSGDFKEAFDAIKAAVSAGDFSAAIAVLVAFIRLEFTRGLNYVKGLWIDLKSWLSQLFDVDLFFGLKQGWIDVVSFMQKEWIELQRKMTSLLAPTQNAFARGWIRVQAALTGQNADDVLATFEEDQKRRGGSVVSGQQFDDQLAAIDRERGAKTAANDQAHAKARDQYAKTHAPELAAAAREKSEAELDNEQKFNDANGQLSAAIAAANAAKSRTPKAIDDAGSAADDAIEVAGKSGKAVGTFSGARLEGLGGASGFDKLADNTSATNGHLKTANDRLKNIEQNTRNANTFT
jgi:hypothetical protein